MALVISLCLAGSAEAAPKKAKKKPAPPSFKQLDKNKDGKLNKKEFDAGKTGKNFAKLDRNNDGSLTAKEFGGKK